MISFYEKINSILKFISAMNLFQIFNNFCFPSVWPWILVAVTSLQSITSGLIICILAWVEYYSLHLDVCILCF